MLSRHFGVRHYQNYINGEWKDLVKSEGEYSILDPSTNKIVAKLDISCGGCIDEAVAAAKEAFREWSQVSVSNRVRYMLKYQALIRENTEWLAETITEEQGKTLVGTIVIWIIRIIKSLQMLQRGCITNKTGL